MAWAHVAVGRRHGSAAARRNRGAANRGPGCVPAGAVLLPLSGIAAHSRLGAADGGPRSRSAARADDRAQAADARRLAEGTADRAAPSRISRRSRPGHGGTLRCAALAACGTTFRDARSIGQPDRAVACARGRASPTAATHSTIRHAERTCFRAAGPRERCRPSMGIRRGTRPWARDRSFVAAGHRAAQPARERLRRVFG